MRLLVLPVLSLILMAAAPPQRGLFVAVPTDPSLGLGTVPRRTSPAPSRLQPAPLPDRTADGPARERSGTDTTVSPTLLQRSDTYRGEGFSRGSTAQAEQEKRFKPGAGFNVKVPFAPN